MGRYNETSHDSKKYLDWLDKAKDDLRAAELLLSSDETLDMAAFHCQQCIEKAIKGYLLYVTHFNVDGHNLTYLCRQAIRYNSHFTLWLENSAVLNRYYIETRYPADIPLKIEKSYIQDVYTIALSMYNFICSELTKQ
jgi:HEPN domain-containing protein